MIWCGFTRNSKGWTHMSIPLQWRILRVHSMFREQKHNIIYIYIRIYLHIKSYIYDHICIHVFYILLQNLDKEGLQACHETYVSNWHPKNRNTPCKINQNDTSQSKARPKSSGCFTSSFIRQEVYRNADWAVLSRHPSSPSACIMGISWIHGAMVLDYVP